MVYAGLPRLLTGWFAHRKWSWATGRPSDLVVWLTSVYPDAMPWDYIAFIGWWVPKMFCYPAACMRPWRTASEAAAGLQAGWALPCWHAAPLAGSSCF